MKDHHGKDVTLMNREYLKEILAALILVDQEVSVKYKTENLFAHVQIITSVMPNKDVIHNVSLIPIVKLLKPVIITFASILVQKNLVVR